MPIPTTFDMQTYLEPLMRDVKMSSIDTVRTQLYTHLSALDMLSPDELLVNVAKNTHTANIEGQIYVKCDDLTWRVFKFNIARIILPKLTYA